MIDEKHYFGKLKPANKDHDSLIRCDHCKLKYHWSELTLDKLNKRICRLCKNALANGNVVHALMRLVKYDN